jgi:RNA polymerase sigma-70 factor (ECF subfamily)
VFDAHQQAVRAYCSRRLPVSHADDAVAEVFLAYWRRLDEAPAEPECRLWLYGIARNVVRNSRRSIDRFSRLKDRASRQPRLFMESPEVVVVRSAEEERLRDVLNLLRAEEREILLLRAWEELSSAEIAMVMDLTPKAVDNRLARVRKKLAKLVTHSTEMAPTIHPQAVEEGGER